MSKPLQEPRIDAKLKTLPDDRQEEIFAKLKADGLDKTRAWLAEDGLQVSLPTLSAFRSWYRLKLQYALKESRALQLMELMKSEQPEISEEKLFKYGQLFFSSAALEEEDSKGWVNVQQLSTSKNLEKEKIAIRKQAEARMQEKLKLERDKFEEMKRKVDQVKEIVESKLSPEDQRRRLKEILK